MDKNNGVRNFLVRYMMILTILTLSVCIPTFFSKLSKFMSYCKKPLVISEIDPNEYQKWRRVKISQYSVIGTYTVYDSKHDKEYLYYLIGVFSRNDDTIRSIITVYAEDQFANYLDDNLEINPTFKDFDHKSKTPILGVFYNLTSTDEQEIVSALDNLGYKEADYYKKIAPYKLSFADTEDNFRFYDFSNLNNTVTIFVFMSIITFVVLVLSIWAISRYVKSLTTKESSACYSENS